MPSGNGQTSGRRPGGDLTRAPVRPEKTGMEGEGAEQRNPAGAEDLLPLVYEELRRVAAARLAGEAPGQTLQATALVHEAWLRVSAGAPRAWNGRAHFFAVAAEAMRRILIDQARRKRAVRHGGGLHRTELPDADALPLVVETAEDELLAVHEALDRFAALEPRKATLVKLRYFAGLTLTEAAEVLEISEPTAKRDWAYARAWLFREIRRAPGGET